MPYPLHIRPSYLQDDKGYLRLMNVNGHVNFLYFSHCHTPQHNNPRTPHVAVAILSVTAFYTPLRLIEDLPVFHFAKHMYTVEVSQKYDD